ncbi:hypothetical protein [Candidatus Poriferisocius sp.]
MADRTRSRRGTWFSRVEMWRVLRAEGYDDHRLNRGDSGLWQESPRLSSA